MLLCSSCLRHLTTARITYTASELFKPQGEALGKWVGCTPPPTPSEVCECQAAGHLGLEWVGRSGLGSVFHESAWGPAQSPPLE